MPRPTAIAKSAKYHALRSDAAAQTEHRDCAVIAVAAATGADYGVAHTVLARHGRRVGRGTPLPAIMAALDELGFEAQEVPATQITAGYPRGHRHLQHVTTHHADRFPHHWPRGAYLLLVSGGRHITAVVDGVNHDWSRGRALRAKRVWRVAPKPA